MWSQHLWVELESHVIPQVNRVLGPSRFYSSFKKVGECLLLAFAVFQAQQGAWKPNTHIFNECTEGQKEMLRFKWAFLWVGSLQLLPEEATALWDGSQLIPYVVWLLNSHHGMRVPRQPEGCSGGVLVSSIVDLLVVWKWKKKADKNVHGWHLPIPMVIYSKSGPFQDTMWHPWTFTTDSTSNNPLSTDNKNI